MGTINTEKYDLDISRGDVRLKKRMPKARRSNNDWYYIVGLIGEIGFSIALPIVIGVLLGSYLDKIWSTFPKATLGLLFAGVVISGIGLVKTITTLIHYKSQGK